jgi:DNA-binding NtrC family response regulator
MPGIDGFDLLEVLAAHRPDLPVLCMSGFPTFAAGPMPRVPFLAKPFTADALRQAIEPVLARARSRASGGAGRGRSRRGGAPAPARARTEAAGLV